MEKKSKIFIRDWLPPALMRHLMKIKGVANRFEGDYRSWQDAMKNTGGYDTGEILDKVLESTLKVKNGEAVYERDSVLFDKIEYSWSVLSLILWVAARNNGCLNVLDFGGSLGSTYFQNILFLKELKDVKWNVVEQQHYVEAGKKHIYTNELRFYKNIEECLSNNQPNIIILSSVLQYLENPYDVLKELDKVQADCLVIDKTPFSTENEDKILTQKVPTSIYNASYPIWIFSIQKMLKRLEQSWNILAQYENNEGCVKSSSGLKFSFQGMLLQSKK